MTGWMAVQHAKKNYNLENSPLQIKTNSLVGSNEEVSVNFYDAKGYLAGGVSLNFKSPSKYFLTYCSKSRTNFPTAFPAETDKIWTMTLSRTSGIRLIINSNNKEVLNVELSDTICNGNSAWSETWTKHVGKIEFYTSDTASDYYRPGKYLMFLLMFT